MNVLSSRKCFLTPQDDRHLMVKVCWKNEIFFFWHTSPSIFLEKQGLLYNSSKRNLEGPAVSLKTLPFYTFPYMLQVTTKKEGEGRQSDKNPSLIIQFYSLCDDSVCKSVIRKTNLITTDQTFPITQAN